MSIIPFCTPTSSISSETRVGSAPGRSILFKTCDKWQFSISVIIFCNYKTLNSYNFIGFSKVHFNTEKWWLNRSMTISRREIKWNNETIWTRCHKLEICITSSRGEITLKLFKGLLSKNMEEEWGHILWHEKNRWY